jgi:hypothetical protein
VTVVADADVAAIVSAVRLDEFGEETVQENLRDPVWLAEKARAHDEVLAAAVGRTTVVPFRFGAIYGDERHVVDLLRGRPDFAETLSRLGGAVELGVKATVDVGVLRDRLVAERGADSEASAGRAYMERKQQERALDEEVARFAAERAQRDHERLAAVARDARLNPVQAPEDESTPQRMILNGAYLVDVEGEARFREELAALSREGADDAVAYELTGPWPPYNFAGGDEEP